MGSWPEPPEIINPDAHHIRHQDGGADELNVGGLSGLLADDQHVLDAEVTAVAIAKASFTQDGGILVGTGAGTFAEETGATLRTSIDTYSTTQIKQYALMYALCS